MNTMMFYVYHKASPHLLISLSWLLISYYFIHPSNGTNIQSLNSHIRCIKQERHALMNFKNGIEVDTCKLITSWGHPEGTQDCCKWPGVHCSNRTGHVIMLDLHGIVNNGYDDCVLVGKLSPSIGELNHLKHLNLSNNQFEGGIPHQLGNLSRLTFLDLSNNYHLFSHSLHWLSHLTLLRHLDLGKTYLNEAADWFQAINNLPSLRVLHLEMCHLPSTFLPPISYINTSTNFNVISLYGNYLNDTKIFQWLFNLSQINTHLVHVDLSLNLFSGPISSEFGRMHTLSYLNLSNNQLEGPIPSEIGNMRSLSYLELSHNHLDGLIPHTIGNLKSLAYLHLSDNSFLGPIPDAIWNLPSLTYLKLSNNLLSGSIPDAIRNFKSLKYLDLSNNSISSIIPESLEYMLSLKYLDLSYNLLSGTIPLRLDQYGLLNSLDLSFNNLSGPIPSALWKFEVVAFSGNTHLCGEPLLERCALIVEGEDVSSQEEGNETGNDDNIYIGLYVSAGIGFYLGFWGVCGTLAFKDSWRHTFFQWIDNVFSKVYVRTACMWRDFIQKNSQTQNL